MTEKRILPLGVLSLCSIAVYLAASVLIYGMGFPLDDAWIHQTYARNLAHKGQWTFLGEASSGGSTGPLWGVLLAPFHFIGLGPLFGAYFLGFLCLWGIAYLGCRIAQVFLIDQPNKGFFVGVLLIFEWHLVWAGASGMETLLFTMLVLWVCTLLVEGRGRWFLQGLVTGAAVWVRPGGITLLGPIFFVLVLSAGLKKWLQPGIRVISGLTTMLAPYVLFHHWISGEFLPNTFYAKQAEYAAVRSLPFLRRFADLGLQPLVGVGVVLLPGLLIFVYQQLKRRAWEAIAPLIWGLGYVMIYAWRLPVSYQHGRYVMPVIPLLIIWGFSGMGDWIQRQQERPERWVITRGWMAVLVIIGVIFWGYGARVYGTDVAVIETEMVRIAKWVDENTRADDVIAAHDIGALGYFTQRELVDIAGLVSPDVIPFVRDEGRLAKYLDSQSVDYLIAFPFWYPDLVQRAEPVFQTGGEFSPRMGMENMVVYRWPAPD